MKKIFAVLLALCLLCGACALADEITGNGTGPKTGSTVVKTTVEESYAISIPAEIVIPFGSTGEYSQSVAVTAYNLLNTHKLSVSYTSQNRRENKDQNGAQMMNGNNSIPYIMMGLKPYTESFATNMITWNLSVKVSDSNDDTADDIKKIWNNAKAGDYSDTLTFTTRIVDR